MSLLRKILVLTAVLLSGLSLKAQTDGYDVFIPITKYISQGNSDNLSAWFADNLEVSILANANDCSRNQARQILKSFFSSHTPRSFSINHTASRGNMKYALGNLNAGGEIYQVTIFVNYNGDTYKIQQLKIDRIQ